MNSNIYKTGLVAAILAATATCVVPAQARYDWLEWQPQVGAIHQSENDLERQLIRDYKFGLIDPLEFANFRRDLDGIRVQEDAYRASEHGLNRKAQARIISKIAQFQNDLDAATGDKADLAHEYTLSSAK